MTAPSLQEPGSGPTRAEIQAQRRAVAEAGSKVEKPKAGKPPKAAREPKPEKTARPPKTPRAPRRRSRANIWLAITAVVLVLVAAGLGAFAFVTYADAQDTRDANQPLQARVTRLRTELSAADTAIDDLAALFISIKAQNDATAAAVAATNTAAAQYNNAEAGIADALGAGATDAVTALDQATAAVKTAAEQVKTAIAALGGTQ